MIGEVVVNREVGSRRIEYIDALRAIAALSVLVVHIAGYLTRQPESPWLAQEFRRLVLEYFDLGLFGVALFFVYKRFCGPSIFTEKQKPASVLDISCLSVIPSLLD
jgi:hypothetical protein